MLAWSSKSELKTVNSHSLSNVQVRPANTHKNDSHAEQKASEQTDHIKYIFQFIEKGKKKKKSYSENKLFLLASDLKTQKENP